MEFLSSILWQALYILSVNDTWMVYHEMLEIIQEMKWNRQKSWTMQKTPNYGIKYSRKNNNLRAGGGGGAGGARAPPIFGPNNT